MQLTLRELEVIRDALRLARNARAGHPVAGECGNVENKICHEIINRKRDELNVVY